MVLPSAFLLADNAREYQRSLVAEAERARLHRVALSPRRRRPHRLQRRIGELLILAGERLRGEDDHARIGHRRTPVSA